MKLTVKEAMLQFVESKGSATFTEIQRFLVERKYGEGSYNRDHRGKYCAAFSTSYYGRKGYFLTGGSGWLVKNGEGTYSVVRK